MKADHKYRKLPILFIIIFLLTNTNKSLSLHRNQFKNRRNSLEIMLPKMQQEEFNSRLHEFTQQQKNAYQQTIAPQPKQKSSIELTVLQPHKQFTSEILASIKEVIDSAQLESVKKKSYDDYNIQQCKTTKSILYTPFFEDQSIYKPYIAGGSDWISTLIKKLQLSHELTYLENRYNGYYFFGGDIMQGFRNNTNQNMPEYTLLDDYVKKKNNYFRSLPKEEKEEKNKN